MVQRGVIKRIQIAREQGAPMKEVTDIEAIADEGLRDDRYFYDQGTFSNRDGCDITLIESETLDAVERDHEISLEPGVHRRNITTRGIALNHLVGRRFRVSNAVCRGVELCEPCAYLEQHLEKDGVCEVLVHRGGLRASIRETGKIEQGDFVCS